MSAPARRSVEFFYDVVSPYSWIGFEVMTRYQKKWNIDLKLKPFFLGGVMQAAGNRAPAMVPSKGLYMTKEMEHLKKHFGMPINHPSNPAEVMFEKGSLAAQRFITAVDMKYPEYTEEVSRQLWLRIWSRDEDITKPESFTEAGQKTGLTMEQIKDALSRLRSQEVKDRLKQNTEEALEAGAFGAPTILVTGQDGKKHMVFGSDRFHIIADILGEKYEGPLNNLSKL